MPWFCEHPDCKRQANFGVKGNKAVLCKEHKSNDMINITKKCCEHTECTRHAQYGYSKNKPLFCNEHKLNGMLHAYYKHCVFKQTIEYMIQCNL